MARPALQAWLDLTRSFGLLIAAGIILLSAVVAGILAVVLGRGDVLITAGLWFGFWLMGPMMINYCRMFWIGAPCGRGASSRWMRVHELWQHRWRPGDIYLGSTLFSSTLFPFHVGQHDDRHLTTIASNRSGKGRSLILNNLHLWQGSALIIDPKGELCRETWRVRQAMGQTVVALDPFGLLAKENGGQPFGIEIKYNPLNSLDLNSPTFTEKLDAFVDAFMPDEGSENIHWRELGKVINKTMITAVLLEDDPGKRTFNHLFAYPCGVPAMIERVERACDDLSLPAPARDGAMAGKDLLATMTDEQIKSSTITALRTLQWASKDAIRNAMSSPVHRSMSALKTEKLTLFIVLPPDKIASNGTWLRLLLRDALAGCTSQLTTPGENVLFLLDECAQLGHLEDLENALGVLAGFGVKIWSIWQDVAQIKRLYPGSWETFIGASGTTQVFGIQDPASRQMASDLCGHRHRRQWEDGDLSHTDPNSVSLLTPDEVARLTRRENQLALVFFHGQHPALLRRVNVDSRAFQKFFQRQQPFLGIKGKGQ